MIAARVRRALRWMRALVFRRAAERDLDDEIHLHLALEADQLVEQGVDPRTAATIARRRFGRIDAVKDAIRAIRGVEPVEDLRRDVLFAARALRRRLGFTTVIALTLVIGLTSATTIFGIVYGALWAPLPYRDAGRIVTVWQTDPAHGIARGEVSAPNFLDWRTRSHSFAALAVAEPYGVRYTTPEGPERFPAWRVSDGFFDALGARPLLGRTFSPDEYQLGRDAVVVLDYDVWRTRFGADSSLVGKTLILNDAPRQVIGVMGPGVRFPPRPGFWEPKIFTPDELLLRNAAYYAAVGRLAPGVSIEQAAGEMRRIAGALSQEYPTADRDVSVALVPLRDDLVGHVRGRLLLLFASVGLLLLLTGANLTALLLARVVDRENELSVRVALGAGRARLARQLLAEHLLLAGLGCGVSLGLAVWALRAVRLLGTDLLPGVEAMRVGLPVVVFALGAALASVVGFGVAPVAYALRVSARGGSGAGSGARLAGLTRRRRQLQHGLVVCDVALALLLVFGAGLFARSFRAILGVDPGFGTTNVLAITLQTEHLYPPDTARAAFARTLESRFAAIPGVERVGMTTALPFAGPVGPEQAGFEVWGRPMPSTREWPSAHAAAVTPGYFGALRIPVERGRPFAPTDDAAHPPVVIVSAAFARQQWGSANPLGQRVRVAFSSDPIVREVVGVVADVHDAGLDQPSALALYVPHAQAPLGGVVFVIETAVAPRSLLSRVRRELGAVNGAMPIGSAATLDELLAASTRGPLLVLAVLGVFAAIALALAAVGVFGVISHLARTRTKELGIRLALGASSYGILRLILREAIALAGIGAAIGAAGALIMGRAVGALLYHVSPLDPLTLAAGVTVTLAVASLAAYVPARRAARADAMDALRD